MRYVLMVLAVAGVVASTLALREHYRTGESPCSINEKWDCGTVNKSPFAMVWGMPIAAIGIAGYLVWEDWHFGDLMRGCLISRLCRWDFLSISLILKKRCSECGVFTA